MFSFGGLSTQASGITPIGNLVFDSTGSLYGVTNGGGSKSGYGVIYQLVPQTGTWKENVLSTFTKATGTNPTAGLNLNSPNNQLYGTTSANNGLRSGSGTIFELQPPAIEGGAWVLTTLHSFGFFADGGVPSSRVTIDLGGTLFGTTLNGGLFGCDGYCGVVYKIVP